MSHPTISIWDRRPKVANPVGGEIPLGQPEVCNLDPKIPPMKAICWARSSSLYYKGSIGNVTLDHWSRRFEYPWVMACGDFKPNQLTLDAAGGDAPLQFLLASQTGAVINMDSDAAALERGKKNHNLFNIIRQVGDLEKTGFPDSLFHRVVCASVLEHCNDPVAIARELWRVLQPSGRLVLTFDVASYARWNHTIDLAMAKRIAALFDLTVPDCPYPDVLVATFPEIERKPDDPETVSLKVLCLVVDKE